jgi:secondary thiamine-phosphate synthase enzyme
MQTLEVRSSEKLQMINITRQVEQVIRESSIESGVCVLYVPHTTAGITINESADPSVEKDILKDLRRMVPVSQQYYEHFEGNSAAHTLSSLVGSSVTILVEAGRLALGRWQGIFYCEFDGPRTRQLYVTRYRSSI